jgi:hypothetical protein
MKMRGSFSVPWEEMASGDPAPVLVTLFYRRRAQGEVAPADEILFDEQPKPKPRNGQATINLFWLATKSREIPKEVALEIVAKHGGDFAAALDSLTA